tara:strand:- start:10657 stop:11445 length:789 start_codon:yes stop_codon:yes gene_type:complete
MIKFFRKIRYKIMETGKTSKYFKYAIGEIVLVVIGILIALSINNWNENLQIKRTNQLFLKKMLIDLDNIDTRLNSIVYTYSEDNDFDYISLTEAINNCDSILKLTYQGLKKEHLKYLATTKTIQGGTLINIYDNTYNELLNTGRLYSLGSDKLVKAIQDFYKFCERETKYQTYNNDEVTRGMIKYEDGFDLLFMNYRETPSNFTLKDYPFYFDFKSTEYKNFQIGLTITGDSQNNNKRKMLKIIKEAQELKNIIHEELSYYD